MGGADRGVVPGVQCSVTCGAGLQSRELLCVGSGGMRLEDVACSAQPRPTLTQACTLAACPVYIGWHVGDWGLVSGARAHTHSLTRAHA